MRFKTRVLTAVFVVPTVLVGTASAEPLVFFTAGGERFDVPTVSVTGGAGIGGNSGPLVFEDEEFRVTISGILDPDPSISYGIAVTDFGAPTAFAFSFFTPIVSVGAPNIVRASIVGGLTDFSGNGVSISPTIGDSDGDGIAEIQLAAVLSPTTGMGVDVGAAFAAGAGSAGAFHSYGPFAAGPMPGPGPGPWTGLSVTTAFLLSGDGDTAALTGFASIDPQPIPEPTSFLLIGSGLLGLRKLRRRT